MYFSIATSQRQCVLFQSLQKIRRLKKASIEDTDTPKDGGNPMEDVMEKIRSGGVKLRKTTVEEKKPPARKGKKN